MEMRMSTADIGEYDARPGGAVRDKDKKAKTPGTKICALKGGTRGDVRV